MLYFSRWKALATLLTAFIVCLFAVPNFFSDATIKRLPAWAQRHVVLGLDLQGGSHILLEVDSNYVRKEKAEQLAQDVQRSLREARIGFKTLPELLRELAESARENSAKLRADPSRSPVLAHDFFSGGVQHARTPVITKSAPRGQHR